MNTYIDIETIPQQPEIEVKAEIAKTIEAPAQMSKPETIAEWHNGEGKYAGVKDAAIEEQYRKTSFDGAKGEICSVSFAVNDGDVVNFNRGNMSEAEILAELFRAIKFQCAGRPPFFIGQNIGGFDLKFIFQRAVILRANPGFDLCQHGRHGQHFYDTMQAWAGYGGRVSQDNLCKALGIEGKPDDIDGSKVWDFYKAGKIERIAEYNSDDVVKVREIHKRLTFIS
jgi:3'-5' exonuclease